MIEITRNEIKTSLNYSNRKKKSSNVHKFLLNKKKGTSREYEYILFVIKLYDNFAPGTAF